MNCFKIVVAEVYQRYLSSNNIYVSFEKNVKFFLRNLTKRVEYRTKWLFQRVNDIEITKIIC